jgi:CRISPR-associated protein Csb2
LPSQALLIEVRMLDGRYHGVGDWPPAPFRLFQALVAGAYGGRWAAEPADPKDAAFRWLERLPPPSIAAPAKRPARTVTHYVPNNDLDAVGGDPRRVAEIRAPKLVKPLLLTGEAPVLYAWPFDAGEEHARVLCGLADRLHILGRGIDPAFASARIAPWEEAMDLLMDHGGAVARPTEHSLGGGPGGAGDPRCPVDGSLDSLKARHGAARSRFVIQGTGRRRTTLFRQPPKPLYRTVAYDRPPARHLFDLVPADGGEQFRSWPLRRAAELVAAARDGAARRLARELPESAPLIDRVLRGIGAGEADKAARPRLLPLPSIGMVHTNPAIRRLLVEIPPDCPLPAADLVWAFTGLDLNPHDPETGEMLDAGHPVLAEASDFGMPRHYGIGYPGAGRGAIISRIWHTVTPAALPVRRPGGRTSGDRRRDTEGAAAAAVRAALRHAAIGTPVEEIQVRREPWTARGERAEAFAPGTRFAADRLWHVRITFATPVAGPLVLGDGRFAGLGLMAPERAPPRDAVAFTLSPACRPPLCQRGAVVLAARRALMSLARQPDGTVPPLFSGHEDGPGPARSGGHRHIYIFALDADGDGLLDRLCVAAPWVIDRSWRPAPGDASKGAAERRLFDRVTGSLAEVRAGPAGLLRLSPMAMAEEGAFGLSRNWRSLTPYQPTRHCGSRPDPAKASAAIVDDVMLECARRALPRPEQARVLRLDRGPRGGLSAFVSLRFATAVAGPLLLGRDAHQGGGLFVPTEE